MFVQYLAEESSQTSARAGGRRVQAEHVRTTIRHMENLDFLLDDLPLLMGSQQEKSKGEDGEQEEEEEEEEGQEEESAVARMTDFFQKKGEA